MRPTRRLLAQCLSHGRRKCLSEPRHGAWNKVTMSRWPLSTASFDQTEDTQNRNTATETQASSSHWRDWFSEAEYGSAWENDGESYLKQSLEDATLDLQTRQSLHWLQELYLFGVYRDHNRVTTHRINHLLQLMVDSSSSSRNNNRNSSSIIISSSVAGLADRGEALLRRMELFDELSNRQGNGLTSQRRWPLPLPRPNRTTFNLVLQLYSRTASTELADGPHRALALVRQMQARYLAVGTGRSDIDLDMKPHAFHWNCVALAYKECTALSAPVDLAHLLFPEENNSGDEDDEIVWDESLLVNTMRVCLGRHHDSEQRKLLGAHVAVKVWQSCIEGAESSRHRDQIAELSLPSHFYAHMLQCIRHFPTEKYNQVRRQYFGKVFVEAAAQGRVNEIVLREFVLHCRNAALLNNHLGPYRKGTMGKSMDDTIPILMERIPQEWKNHADSVQRP